MNASVQDSFEHVREWLGEVQRHAAPETVKLLVGNKADRTDKVSEAIIMTMAIMMVGHTRRRQCNFAPRGLPTAPAASATCYRALPQAVTTADGEALAKELAMPFLETSACTAYNVEAAFTRMAENLIKMR